MIFPPVRASPTNLLIRKFSRCLDGRMCLGANRDDIADIPRHTSGGTFTAREIRVPFPDILAKLFYRRLEEM